MDSLGESLGFEQLVTDCGTGSAAGSGVHGASSLGSMGVRTVEATPVKDEPGIGASSSETMSVLTPVKSNSSSSEHSKLHRITTDHHHTSIKSEGIYG